MRHYVRCSVLLHWFRRRRRRRRRATAERRRFLQAMEMKVNDVMVLPATTMEMIETCEKIYFPSEISETLDLELLRECLSSICSSLKSSSPPHLRRREAESKLHKASTHPHFPLALLRLVAGDGGGGGDDDVEVREAAADKLKSHLLVLCGSHAASAVPIITKCEKELLKTIIFCLVISHPTASLLVDSLDVLANDGGGECGDSPESWHRPLIQLFSMLQHYDDDDDDAISNATRKIDNIAKSITTKFLQFGLTLVLIDDLKQCSDDFINHVFDISRTTAAATTKLFIIDNDDDNNKVMGDDSLCFHLECQRLCCKIFCSLHLLSNCFLKNRFKWFGEVCEVYFDYKFVKEGDVVRNSFAVVDGFLIALCETLCAWLIKYPIDPSLHKKDKDMLEKMLRFRSIQCHELSSCFTYSFCTLLWEAEPASTSGNDRLIIAAAIKCLIRIWDFAPSMHFSCSGLVPDIVRRIVIPYVHLRDEDVDLFGTDYIRFFHSDDPGPNSSCTDSSSISRRVVASKLLNKLAADFVDDFMFSINPVEGRPFEIAYLEDSLIPLVSAETDKLLSSFAENPALNWKEKDCAIHLFLSFLLEDPNSDDPVPVPYETETRREENKRLVSTLAFFESNIVPELLGQDVNEFPVIKAGALKFLTMLVHNHVPMSRFVHLIPHVIRFLGSDSTVVCSFAAMCLEKFLSSGDYGFKTGAENDIITQYIPLIVTNLLNALRVPQFEDNAYIMRCIKRVVGVASVPGEVSVRCFSCLAFSLQEVCFSQENHLFHCYLFEALADILKRAEDDLSLLSEFDAIIFPIFQTILSNRIIKIFPSVFQLLAQFVELSRQPIPPYYMKFFERILLGDLWSEPLNIPSLAVLLRAFLDKASLELIQNGSLIKLLHRVPLLFSSSVTEEVGFHLLNVLLDNLEYNDFKPLLDPIWPTFLMLLRDYPREKFLKSFVVFISLFVTKHGAARLEHSMSSVHPDSFILVVKTLWIPSLKLIKDAGELKLAAVASIMILSGSPALLDTSRDKVWGELLDNIVTLLVTLTHDKAEKGESLVGTQDTEGCATTFVHLSGFGKKKEDPVSNIKDTNEYLVTSLGKLSAVCPGKYPRIIRKSLDSCNQAALELLCSTYNGTIF